MIINPCNAEVWIPNHVIKNSNYKIPKIAGRGLQPRPKRFIYKQLPNYNNTIANWIFVSGMERSGFPETLMLSWFREIVPHSRNNKF